MDNNIDIKVSVIMPIYNADKYLASAIDSVLAQTLTELELICIDDGSTDDSLKILKEYRERDERIRIVTENNAGPGLARNNGIRRSRGEYIAFVDADDFLAPSFLESLYTYAKENELDIAISSYDMYNDKSKKYEVATKADHSEIYKDGKITSKNENPDYILSSTVGSAWNKLFRRAFIEEKKLSFLQEVRIYEDVYFVVSALSLAERVGRINEVLMHHRIHSEQSRAKMFKKHYAHVPMAYAKVKEFLVHNGMYAPLSRSFINLSASRCYRIFNLLSGDSKENFWNQLHTEYADQMDWSGKSADQFESAEVYEFANLASRCGYKEYKKKNNRKEKKEAVGKKRGFFARLFRKA